MAYIPQALLVGLLLSIPSILRLRDFISICPQQAIACISTSTRLPVHLAALRCYLRQSGWKRGGPEMRDVAFMVLMTHKTSDVWGCSIYRSPSFRLPIFPTSCA
ncbi:hypothetical protein BDZ89DRAFT_664581 [Hymenopellis radicata]|nr:hypothetical protein BDZ89DRAFT_664581 [Hymenopellis radicata]